MNPLRVWASGYRTFDHLDFDVPLGCAAIVGPNGAGKSSIVNLVDVALFADRGELNDLLSVDHDELEVGIEFEHAGGLYRVRRQLRRGKSATCDFEHAVPAYDEADLRAGIATALTGEDPGLFHDKWEPLTREKVDETGKLIAETIGLNRDSFRASAFMAQNGPSFAEIAAAKRKEMLAEMLRLEKWERRREMQAAAAKQCEIAIARISGQEENLQREVADRAGLITTLTDRRADEVDTAAVIERIENQLEEAQNEIAAAAGAQERVRACEAELQTARAAEMHARDLVLEAQQAVTLAGEKAIELRQAREHAGKADTVEAELAEARRLQQADVDARELRRSMLEESNRNTVAAQAEQVAAESLQGRAAVLHEKVDLLASHAHDDTAECEACGQKLTTPEARQRLIDGWNTEAATLLEHAEAHRADQRRFDALAADVQRRALEVQFPEVPDVARLEGDLARARAAATRQAELEQLIAAYQEKANRHPLLHAELDQLAAATADKQRAVDEARATNVDTAELERQVRALRGELVSARNALDLTRRTIAALETQLQAMDDAENTLRELRDRRGELQRDLNMRQAAQQAFGRNGVPALIVEAIAVPQLEAEANRVLELLPMADGRTYQLEVRTQTENKSNQNVRETLDIVVYDRGVARDIETFSGGEQMRINIALRRALTLLLAHRRGAETRFLAIDEPDGLDSTALQALPEILGQLVDAGELDRVLVVSHQPELATGFEHVIEVVNNGGRSRIEGELSVVAA